MARPGLAAALILTLCTCNGAQERGDGLPASGPSPLMATPEVGLTPVRASVPGALVPGELAMASGEDMALLGDFGKYVFERNTDRTKQQAPEPGQRVLPGAIIDAQGTGGGQDGLLALTPGVAFDKGPLEPVAALEVSADDKSGGALIAFGRLGDKTRRLSVTSRAVLGRQLPHLIITTTIVNEGSAPVRIRPGDRLRFGAGHIFVGDEGKRSTDGEVKTNWLGHERVAQGYGYTIDGSRVFLARVHASGRGDGAIIAVDALADPVTLAPGDRISHTRRFLASGEGMPGVLSWLDALQNKPTGRVQGTVKIPKGEKLDVAEFELVLKAGGRFIGHLPVRTGFGIDAPLPPGGYTIEARGPWGLEADKVNFNVVAGQTAPLKVAFGPLGVVDVEVNDARSGGPMAASIVVERAAGGPVFLGTGVKATQAGPIMHLPEGRGVLKLPPGDYRLTATRGPEYTIQTSTVSVEVGRDRAAFSASLRRVLPTPGHVMADMRTYSARDQIGAASPAQIALAMLCSGIEVAAISDEASAQSLALGVTEAGMRGLLGPVPALSTDPLGPRVGLFTVLPADITGALMPTRARSPEPLIEALRKTSSDSPFVSVIWPRNLQSGGYFDRYQLDRGTGLTTRNGASSNFDGIEVFPGEALRLPADQQKTLMEDFLADWSALVTKGLRYTATGASGSARLGHAPVGLPFTWIDVGEGNDRPDVAQRQVVEGLRENRAVVSTGPFVTFSIDGKGPGNLVTPRRKRRKKPDAVVRIKVVAPAWMDINRVVLFKEGEVVKRWTVEGTARDDVVSFEASHPLLLQSDTWFHVRVYGDTPLPTAPHLKVKPFAMTNPIWVDGNRDRDYKR